MTFEEAQILARGPDGDAMTLWPERAKWLWESASQALSLDGEFWECGVYRGGSARLPAELIKTSDKPHRLRLFDTFEGFISVQPEDGSFHAARVGEMKHFATCSGGSHEDGHFSDCIRSDKFKGECMKKIISLFALAVSLMFVPSVKAQALSGSQRNITVQAPPNYLCVPVDANSPATTIPYTCTGYATVLQNTTTFTTLTVTVNRPIIGSQQISVAVEDFTLGTNVVYCILTAGQKTCQATFSTTINAGDVLAVKLYNNLSGPNYYNLEDISWVMQ